MAEDRPGAQVGEPPHQEADLEHKYIVVCAGCAIDGGVHPIQQAQQHKVDARLQLANAVVQEWLDGSGRDGAGHEKENPGQPHEHAVGKGEKAVETAEGHEHAEHEGCQRHRNDDGEALHMARSIQGSRQHQVEHASQQPGEPLAILEVDAVQIAK